MIVPIDLLLLFFLLIIGIAALWVKDLLAAIVLTGAFSFIMANVDTMTLTCIVRIWWATCGYIIAKIPSRIFIYK